MGPCEVMLDREQSRGNLLEENLASAIHRLPNEVLMHIFVLGCPVMNHANPILLLGERPPKHQTLVTSICRLWRELARNAPQLWRYIVLFGRIPQTKEKREIDIQMLQSALMFSGTLELDLVLHAGNGRTGSECEHIGALIPHLHRVRTLAVSTSSLLPLPDAPELERLRYLYIGGAGMYLPRSIIFPANARRSPLEVFRYSLPCPLDCSLLPTSKLSSLQIYDPTLQKNTLDIINLSSLTELGLETGHWGVDMILSSSTLTHAHLSLHRSGPQTSCLLGSLPNLRHLTVSIQDASAARPNLAWPLLPSLRSLCVTIHNHKPQGTTPYTVDLLSQAPHLVALRIGGLEVVEVIDYLCDRWRKGIGDDGDCLRLIQIIIGYPRHDPPLHNREDELPRMALALQTRPLSLQTEMCIYGTRALSNWVTISDAGIIPLHGRGSQPSVALSDRAERILQDDTIMGTHSPI